MIKKKFLFVFIVLLLLSQACNFTKIIDKPAADPPPQVVPESATVEPKVNQPATQEQPTQPSIEPIAEPVGIRKGLSSLDTYKFTIEIESIGPSSQEVSRMQYQLENSSPQDASFNYTTNFEQTLEDPEPSTSQSNTYQVGNESCSGSPEDGYTYTITEPDVKELQDIMKDLYDLDILIENPQFIGEEEMNGILSNHFQFQLSGLGIASGAEVLANQGEYWLAADGNYIVRYTLLVETSPAPGELNHLKVFVNLEEANQPKNLTMPQFCIDAKNNPE
jgi:hypothetical protein